jgi:transcriptional regulator with XRE-family HTH domain
MTLADVAGAAGLSDSAVQSAESGRVASLDTYLRLARALHLRPQFDLVDPRRRDPSARKEDPVHAAMGESEAARLRSLGFEVRVDEPYQHYRFAGRGDIVAWSIEPCALLHIENRTAFPDIQEVFGSFNAKREYIGRELATRAGVARWKSQSHVMVALWSADILHTVRRHRATFESLGSDGPAILDGWWSARPSSPESSGFVLFDPVDGPRADAIRWTGTTDLASIRPRYRDYMDALLALRAAEQD